ncbi:hypothetical protein OHA37_12000 [Streptomyces sp. NBC_00335]|nr:MULTISPECIES: hypothetical protein [unclassified Streptomyces]MCX5404602.1 hypothetical protein [Streptomyces sp. NBC_00086]
MGKIVPLLKLVIGAVIAGVTRAFVEQELDSLGDGEEQRPQE